MLVYDAVLGAYADDLVLLAPTHSAMQKLLAVCECEKQAQEFSIKFNAKKSKRLAIVSKKATVVM